MSDIQSDAGTCTSTVSKSTTSRFLTLPNEVILLTIDQLANPHNRETESALLQLSLTCRKLHDMTQGRLLVDTFERVTCLCSSQRPKSLKATTTMTFSLPMTGKSEARTHTVITARSLACHDQLPSLFPLLKEVLFDVPTLNSLDNNLDRRLGVFYTAQSVAEFAYGVVEHRLKSDICALDHESKDDREPISVTVRGTRDTYPISSTFDYKRISSADQAPVQITHRVNMHTLLKRPAEDGWREELPDGTVSGFKSEGLAFLSRHLVEISKLLTPNRTFPASVQVYLAAPTDEVFTKTRSLMLKEADTIWEELVPDTHLHKIVREDSLMIERSH